MFSRKLKELRFKNDITQSEFARILGVSQQAVGSWEKNLTYPNIETLKQIAKYFNVSIDYLLDNDGDSGKAGATALNEDETNLILVYRGMSESDKAFTREFIARFGKPDSLIIPRSSTLVTTLRGKRALMG